MTDWQSIALGHARQLREQSERSSREAKVAANEIAALRAELERRDSLLDRMTTALRKVRTLGGSELFIRFGSGASEKYYADPEWCGNAIDELRTGRHSALAGQARAEKRADTAERRAADLERELREARKALEPFALAAGRLRDALGDPTSDVVGETIRDLTFGHYVRAERIVAAARAAASKSATAGREIEDGEG